jgi:hypothetical protein
MTYSQVLLANGDADVDVAQEISGLKAQLVSLQATFQAASPPPVTPGAKLNRAQRRQAAKVAAQGGGQVSPKRPATLAASQPPTKKPATSPASAPAAAAGGTTPAGSGHHRIGRLQKDFTTDFGANKCVLAALSKGGAFGQTDGCLGYQGAQAATSSCNVCDAFATARAADATFAMPDDATVTAWCHADPGRKAGIDAMTRWRRPTVFRASLGL